MLELQGITKIYKSGRRGKCCALNEVSFNLPERGMVFVLGKSGSGKSTLLNILGGLDSASSGELQIDGNPFSSLTSAQQDDYRNQCVGFVFQDFCLIDELNVTDNVRLSLDLLGQKDDERIEKLLSKVGLDAERKRYPHELSGGQCQRVAIARAIAKFPRILLADEPTGNLDSKTAKQILNLLKELSRECLVVVVSHNISDAENYADRIIELADGRVVRDVERTFTQDMPLIADGLITLPRGKVLSENELEAINRKISEDSVQIVQADDPFAPTKPISPHPHKPLGKPKRMRAASYLRLTRMFSRGGYMGTALTALMLSALTVLLCLAQCFALFDSETLIRQALQDTDTNCFTLHKGYYADPMKQKFKTDKTIAVTDEDIAAFYDAGYKGDVYPLYITNLAFDYPWTPSPASKGKIESIIDYSSPYARCGNGVLVTNEEFIARMYGQNGKLKLLAGEISDSANNEGVLISDYAADCILYYQKHIGAASSNPYQAIVDAERNARTNISGVFETGYKERYADLFAQYDAMLQMTDEARHEAARQMVSSTIFNDFLDEVNKYLGIGYYLGEDYHQKVISLTGLNDSPRFHNTDIYVGDTLCCEGITWMYIASNNVASGTAIIGANILNKALGTNFSADGSDFYPVKLTLVGYANGALDTDEALYTHTVTVVSLSEYPDLGLCVSNEDFTMLHDYDHYAYALYFENAESAFSIYDAGSSPEFYTSNAYMNAVYTVKEIVEVFRDIFLYAELGVILIALLLIASFSLRSLRRKMKEIGILRAFGATTGQIVICFILQMIALWLVVVLLSLMTFPLLLNNANVLLVDNLAEFLDHPAIGTLTVLSPTWVSILSALAVFLPVLLLSLCVPLFFIRGVKPIKIIRSSDA